MSVQAAFEESVRAACGLHECFKGAEVEAELRQVTQHLPARSLGDLLKVCVQPLQASPSVLCEYVRQRRDRVHARLHAA